jgi:hypothetical protein
MHFFSPPPHFRRRGSMTSPQSGDDVGNVPAGATPNILGKSISFWKRNRKNNQ